jgi:hypothetical protein
VARFPGPIMSLVGYEGQRLPIRESFPLAVKEFLSSSFKESIERPAFPFVVHLFRDLCSKQPPLEVVRSSSCDETKIIREIGNLFTSLMLELTRKIDRDQSVIAARQEEALNETFEELKLKLAI